MRPIRRFVGALGLVFGGWLRAADSHGQPLPSTWDETPSAPLTTVRVAIDGAEPTRLIETMRTRLRAELKVGGFIQVAADMEPGGPTYADIVISARGERLLLDVTTRSANASSHVLLAGGEREIGALALQAVEFLRAGLVPRVLAEPKPQVLAPPLQPPVPQAVPTGRAYFDLTGTLLRNWGGKDQLALLSLGAGYAGPGRLSLGISGAIPLTTSSFRATRGSAEYQMWLSGLEADYAFWQSSGGEVALGSMVGAALVTARGESGSNARGQRPAAWSLTLGAKLRAQLHLSSYISLQAEGRVVALSPNQVVAVLDEERRLGAPSALFSVGVRIGGR